MPRSGVITIDKPGGLHTIEDASKIPRNRATISLNSLSRGAKARQVGGFKKWNDTAIGSGAAPVHWVHPCTFVDVVTVDPHLVAQRDDELYDVAASGASTLIHTWATGGLTPAAAWFDDIQIFACRDAAGNAGAIQQWDGGASTVDLTGASGILSTFPDPGAATQPLEDIRPAIIFSTGKGPGAGTVGGQQASPDTHLFALDYIDTYDDGAPQVEYHRNRLAWVNLAKPPTGSVRWSYAVVGGGREDDKNYCVAGAVYGAHVFVWRRYGDLYRFRYVVDPTFLAGDSEGFFGEHIPFFEEMVSPHGIVKTPGPMFFPCRSGIWAMLGPDEAKPVKASRVLEGTGGIWEQINKDAMVTIVGAYDSVKRIVVWQVPFGTATVPTHWLVLELPDRDVDLANFEAYEWHVWQRYTSSFAYMAIDPAGTDHGQFVWGHGIDDGFIWVEDDTLLQGGSEDAVVGTVTASGAATLTDSGAAFDDTAIGRPVVFYDAITEHQELGFVSARTATQLTVAQNWSTPPLAGARYVLGGLEWRWRSKKFKPAAGLQWFSRVIAQVEALGAADIRMYTWKDNEPDADLAVFAVTGGVSLLDFILGTSALSENLGEMQDLEGFIDSTADRIQIGMEAYGSGVRVSLVTAEIAWQQESLELDR
jgi:hypothetical protein